MASKPRKGDAAAAANGGDAGDDLMAWVAKSRKLDEKRRAEKEKAERMARMLADQDDAAAEDEHDDEQRGGWQRSLRPEYTSRDLAGMRVRHGVGAVLQEGAAVVLTLKDASILAGDDVNEGNAATSGVPCVRACVCVLLPASPYRGAHTQGRLHPRGG
ncbi:unnamed protein product [Closterium sp. Yama58-4]|nr:unnamed protein product [Closterium sp. Yama58-4]